MSIFFKEYMLTLFILSIYGLIGGFSLYPFRGNIKYPILAAPMAGMLLWAIGVYIFYCFLGLSVQIAAISIAVIGSSITIASLTYTKPKCSRNDIVLVVSLVTILGAFITYLTNYTSIQFGNVGFLYREGSDHLGYAMMADWLQNHTIKQLPIENISYPYQSFPALLVKIDPRFGSFFSLAIISSILGRSSTFVFDIACSVVLLTGYLGVTSLYSRSPKTLVLLSVGLFFNYWFLLCRTGFFAKILAFPAIFFVLGLYFIQQNNHVYIKNDKFAWIVTLVLTLATAMVYPGYVLSIFLVTVGGTFLLIKALSIFWNFNNEYLLRLRDSAGLLFIMVLIGLAAAGMLTYPQYVLPPIQSPFDWASIFSYQLDVRAIAYDQIFNWYTPSVSIAFLIIAISILVMSLFITLIKREMIAITLIVSPLILLLIPYTISNKWIAFELAGTLYVLSICGCSWYISDSLNKVVTIKDKILIRLVYFLMIATIAIRVPSFFESIHRYVVFGVPPSMQYSKQEMEHLAKIIKNDSLIVDIPNVMFALPILTEFGRHDMNLQWTPESWKAILGYRTWQAPALKPSHLVLGLVPDVLTILNLKSISPKNCKIIATTRQYQLFNCPQLNVNDFPFTYKKNK